MKKLYHTRVTRLTGVHISIYLFADNQLGIISFNLNYQCYVNRTDDSPKYDDGHEHLDDEDEEHARDVATDGEDSRETQVEEAVVADTST